MGSSNSRPRDQIFEPMMKQKPEAEVEFEKANIERKNDQEKAAERVKQYERRMAEVQAKFEKASNERRDDQEKAAERDRKQYEQRMAEAEAKFDRARNKRREDQEKAAERDKQYQRRMAEAEAKFEKASNERRDYQERAEERDRKQYEQRMEEKDKHHKDMMEQKEKHVEDLKEQNRRAMQVFKEMHAETLSHQTEQIKALTKGMEAINGGLNKMQARLTGQTPPPQRRQSNISDQGLKKICVVMLDNIGPLSDIREYVFKDQETLEHLFRSVGSDIKQIRRGENLALASQAYGRENYSAYDMIFVIVFRPGSNMTFINGPRSFEIDELCEPFRRNPTLTGKPKIFLIHIISDDTPSLGGAESARSDLRPTEDVLICHCELSEELYKSTSTEIGSFFVKSLGYVFRQYSRTYDVAEILEQLGNEVTAEQEEEISFGLVNGLKSKVYLPQV